MSIRSNIYLLRSHTGCWLFRKKMYLTCLYIIMLLLAGCNRKHLDCEVEQLTGIHGLVGGKSVIAYSQTCDGFMDLYEYVNVSVVEPGIDIRHGAGNVMCLSHESFVRIEKQSPDTVVVFIPDFYHDNYMELQEERYAGITFRYVGVDHDSPGVH